MLLKRLKVSNTYVQYYFTNSAISYNKRRKKCLFRHYNIILSASSYAPIRCHISLIIFVVHFPAISFCHFRLCTIWSLYCLRGTLNVESILLSDTKCSCTRVRFSFIFGIIPIRISFPTIISLHIHIPLQFSFHTHAATQFKSSVSPFLCACTRVSVVIETGVWHQLVSEFPYHPFPKTRSSV